MIFYILNVITSFVLSTYLSEGSCKIFAFANLHNFDKEQALACFGTFRREDVLNNPNAHNHQNIRNFMKLNWLGIKFENIALQLI